MHKIYSAQDIVTASNNDSSNFFFRPNTMKLSKSRVSNFLKVSPDFFSALFITSEAEWNDAARLYTIRKFTQKMETRVDGRVVAVTSVSTLEGFQAFSSLREAKKVALGLTL